MGNTVGSRSAKRGVDPVTTDSRLGRDEMIIPLSNTSISSHAGFSKLSNEQFAVYISGYVDGEGSFSISIYRRTKLNIGWEVRPSFSVCQKREKNEVLELMLLYFKCGSIRNCITDDVDHYEVRSIDSLITTIIPHFEKYPLLSSRQLEFEYFKAICYLVYEKQHLIYARLY